LFSHGEEFKGGIFFNLFVSYIVVFHVNLSTFEELNRLGVLTEFVESFNCFFMCGVISSVHEYKHLFVPTANLRFPGLTYNLFNVFVLLMGGDRSTLVVRGQFIF
jgi:hypothetical protein